MTSRIVSHPDPVVKPDIQCPYNPAHFLYEERFQRHLVTCGTSHPEIAAKMETCKFNPMHVILKSKMFEHLQECPDRRIVVPSQSSTPLRRSWDGTLDWNEAYFLCKLNGASLASIHSSQEQSIIEDLLGDRWGWIGLFDTASEGNFLWEDGSALDYVNWMATEPSDSGPGEDCVIFAPSYGWSDQTCTRKFMPVCKKPI